MSDELQRLRGQNPVPGLMSPLPIEAALARLESEPSTTIRSHDSPWGARRVARAVPVALSVAVVFVVAGLLITGGHSRAARSPANHLPGSSPSSKGLAHAPGHRGGPARRSAGRDLIDQLFPRSGADWATAGELATFTLRVRIKAETRCLAAEGFPGPPVVYGQPSAPFGIVGMPNLTVIARTMNVGVTTVHAATDPARSLSPTRRRAYPAAVSRCAAATRATDALSTAPSVNRLLTAWTGTSASALAVPAVRAANRRGVACSRHTKFPARSVSDEEGRIEGKLTPLNIEGATARANAVNAAGVRVLIRCFGPVVTLDDRLLTAARARFLATHAKVVHELEDHADRRVAADEARYTITLTPVGPTSTVPVGIGDVSGSRP